MTRLKTIPCPIDLAKQTWAYSRSFIEANRYGNQKFDQERYQTMLIGPPGAERAGHVDIEKDFSGDTGYQFDVRKTVRCDDPLAFICRMMSLRFFVSSEFFYDDIGRTFDGGKNQIVEINEWEVRSNWYFVYPGMAWAMAGYTDERSAISFSEPDLLYANICDNTCEVFFINGDRFERSHLERVYESA